MTLTDICNMDLSQLNDLIAAKEEFLDEQQRIQAKLESEALQNRESNVARTRTTTGYKPT